MRKLIRFTLAGFVLLVSSAIVRAADDDSGPPGQNKVPPGLQKKGGLPPGQAKKRARQSAPEEPAGPASPATPADGSTVTVISTTSVTTTPTSPATPTATATTTVVTPGAAAPERFLDKDALERRARLNRKIERLRT